MRRIKNIEALDVLIAWNKKSFFKVSLRYGLVPPKRECPGEDGYTMSHNENLPDATLSRDDLLNLRIFPSVTPLTLESVQSRN